MTKIIRLSQKFTDAAGQVLTNDAGAILALPSDGANSAAIVSGAATGVLGLRVYGGPTDPISDIPVWIDTPHHHLHEGEMHQYTYGPAAAAQNSVANFRVVVPALTPTLRTPHPTIEIDTTGETWLELFEAPTFSAPGTPALSYNRNRNSANAPQTTIYTAPTVLTTGTRLSAWIIGSGQKAGGATRDSVEWDYASSTEYLIRTTSKDAQNICLRFVFYEDLGV